MSDKILALDQSLTETGWYTEGGFGVILTDKKGVERLADIRLKIVTLVAKYKINTLVIEDYSYGSRGRGIFNLGELGGMIRLLAHDNNLKLVVVQPTVLKKFIIGKGNAGKELMLLNVYKKYGFETDNNNIADAFALYTFYTEFSKWKSGVKYPANKTDIFEKFEHPKNRG